MDSEETGREEEVSEKRSGKWSTEEHERYLEAMQLYEEQKGKVTEKWNFIRDIIKTRTVQQCRSHHQKHEQKVKRLENKREEQKLIDAAAEQSRPNFFQRDHQMPPYSYNQYQYQYPYPYPYSPIYSQHPSHQQEQAMMRHQQDQAMRRYQEEQAMIRHHQNQYSQYLPPNPLPHQYPHYDPSLRSDHQQPQPSHIPEYLPQSDHTSVPPRPSDQHK